MTTPWATYRIDDPHVIALSAASAILTYLATAQRTGEAPYTARMTTVFIKQESGWKTAFHQQTPVSA